MAKTFVDVNVFGAKWFNKILPELEKTKSVTFVYSPHVKILGEHEKARKAGRFYKIMGDKGRRVDVESTIFAGHISYLEGLKVWQAEDACDDPHVFALTKETAFRYIFSEDMRLAKCRNCMIKVVQKEYCRFSLIKNDKLYKTHRQKILS